MSSTPNCLQVSGVVLKSSTHHGLVAVIRTGPGVYEVRKDGVLLGTVKKFQHWYARPRPPSDHLEHKGSSRKDCIDWLSHWDHVYKAQGK